MSWSMSAIGKPQPVAQKLAAEFVKIDYLTGEEAAIKLAAGEFVSTLISIPRCPLSPNGTRQGAMRIRGLHQMHWRARNRYNRGWHVEMMAASSHLTKRDVIGRRFRVSIELYHPRLYDPDNAFASVKPVLDAMRKCNLIYNDSPAWIELEVRQVQSQEEHMEIIISEVS